MNPILCPSCQVPLSPQELTDGWCENCGKKIPRYVLHEAGFLGDASEAPASPTKTPARPARRREFIEYAPALLLILIALLQAGAGFYARFVAAPQQKEAVRKRAPPAGVLASPDGDRPRSPIEQGLRLLADSMARQAVESFIDEVSVAELYARLGIGAIFLALAVWSLFQHLPPALVALLYLPVAGLAVSGGDPATMMQEALLVALVLAVLLCSFWARSIKGVS